MPIMAVPPAPARRTEAATAGHMKAAALRAADDPAVLNRAARIVRAAILRKRLTLADLQGDIVQPSDLGASDAQEAA